ncbi:MAG: cache domain-containing protein [Oscillospiraceae bacterium]|nr:cache domain-containing protein [Oscillospiraceae bacterium]
MTVISGIKAKILAPAVVIILAVAAAILVSNIVQFSGFVDDSTVSRVDAATKVALNSLEALKAETAAVSLSIARAPAVIEAVSNRNSDALLARALAEQRQGGVDFCTVTDAEGRVIARTHSPEEMGDDISFQANIRSAMYGEPLTAIEQGAVVRLSVRSGSPVYNAAGEVVGVVSAGFRLDTDRFVDGIKEMIGCETTIVLGDERISTTVVGENGVRVVGTKADAHVTETVLSGNTYSGRVDILGRVAVCRYSPINGPDGKAIGMLFIGQYFEEELSTIGSFVRGSTVITVVMLILSIAVLLIIVGHIIKPLRSMTAVATALAAGETDLSIQVQTNDETRTLADAFNSMIENTRRQVEMVEQIAGGDENVNLRPRSEKDLMNRALEKLNATIQAQAAEIRSEHERVRVMLDANPLASRLWNRNFRMIECNQAAVKLFGLKDKQEYIERYYELQPEIQPDGRPTREKIAFLIHKAFEAGESFSEWMYRLPDGTDFPAEVKMVRVPYGDDYVVAAYSRDLREPTKMITELRYRDQLLETVNQAADILLRSEPGEFEETLSQCMGSMACAIGADRMRVIKNYLEDGKLYCSLQYEWVGDVWPIQGTPMVEHISYDKRTPKLKEVLTRGVCINSPVREMPPAEREWFNSLGILSMLLVPIFIRDTFWGLVSFENCQSEQPFTENQESVMRSGSLLVVNALLRNESILRVRDTSAQLETALAEAKRANSAKSDFLASMSHEMRTPLNAIIGLSEIALSGGEIDEDVKLNLEKIFNSGSTLLSIVNDILDISKIQSGKFEIMPIDYDVPSLINDSVLQNILRIGSRPIRFVLDIGEDLPARLKGDDLRVKQIISNLLSNAFKYTEKGTVELALSCERDGGSVWMDIRVSDTGIGIHPDHLERLYVDFEQFGATSRHQAGGTGLGLSITKSLAEMMDGAISVTSEYGTGSTFNVRIRQEQVGNNVIGANVADSLKRFQYSANKLTRNTRAKRVRFPYARVLLVDDNITNLDVAKGLMKPYGMRIDCLTGGADAVRAIREEKVRYSAIFMDHMMPGMDGVEATRIIREEIGTEYARTVPIIALTANAIAGSEKMFLSKGFQAFISKPIDIMKLDSVLHTWVRDKSQEDGLATEQAGVESEYDGNQLAGVTVRGLDIESALERFNGDSAVLFDVLRSYAAGTRPLLQKLREDLAAGDMGNYAVTVHGIKGSSFGITASEVGKKAEALEKAAKAGDTEAVRAGHPVFEVLVSELLGGLDDLLNKIGLDKPVAAAPDPETLRELRRACEVFDMDGVDNAMEKLEAFRYERGGDLVRWLREQVGNMAFEEISGMSFPEVFTEGDELPVIEGIDSEQGVRHSGSKALYTKLLRNFYKLIDFKSAQIERYLAEGRILDLTVRVHAMKTNAQIVGANELADAFRKLEAFGTEGDRAALEEALPEVLALYRSFKPRLRVFAEAGRQSQYPVSRELLCQILRRLVLAADSFDLDGTDSAVKELEGCLFPGLDQDKVERISAYAADVAMEEVIRLTEEILLGLEEA